MAKPSRTHHVDLCFRGHVQGLVYLDPRTAKPLCYFFGGVPYALPPLGLYRFQKPRPLPPCYRYGTSAKPAPFTSGCGVCPQPGSGGAQQQENEGEWDEDCLQSNVWVPMGEPPAGGWPVLFWIHGGFLQFGTPNTLDLRAFLDDSPCKCIVVAPAYRLNIFGFVASQSLSASCPDYATNLGFWDQRLALQWTRENISYFGGNASNITVGGYSAGSHSVFHQLAYDLDMPDGKAIIKRAMMLSNGPGMQPKTLEEAETQYQELLSVLNIPPNLPPSMQLSRLRATDANVLIRATRSMQLDQFRAVSDTSFVRPRLLSELTSGAFATRLRARNLHLVLGECRDEHHMYSTWRPPTQPGYTALLQRLQADYSTAACRALLAHYLPQRSLPPTYTSWQEAFGRIYADVQVHALERGMARALVAHGAAHLLHRYRIELRAKCVDATLPPAWGVTHTSDLALWFWGNGAALTAWEKKTVADALLVPLDHFLHGREAEMQWAGVGGLGVRTLKGDGRVVLEDEEEGMEEAVRVWEVLARAGAMGEKEGEVGRARL